MNKQTGFTMLELIVVMAIIVMLGAIVGPTFLDNLGRGNQASATAQIGNLEAALDTYRLDVGSYPDSLSGLIENDSGNPRWNGPYLRSDEIPLDPWDNPYQYEPAGRDFTLMSYGADGAPGGEGDDADIGK